MGQQMIKRVKLTELEELEREETARLEHGSALCDLYVEGPKELLEYAQLETSFLVQDAIPEMGLVYFLGHSESGKSWLGYDLCFAVARARPWLVFRNVQRKPRPVLVLNFDNPPGELARRFLRMGLSPDDRIHFHSLARKRPPEGLPALLTMPQSLEGILAIVDYLRPGLILIDSLRSSHTLDEVNSAHMNEISSCLRHLTAFGATVVAIHHKRKSQEQKAGKSASELSEEDDASMRGSGQLIASADAIIHFTRAQKLPGETSGVLRMGKTRGFTPSMAQCDYAIRDDIDGVVGTTSVVPGGRLDTVLAAIKKHGPITRRDLLRKVAGLEPKRLTQLVNLCIEFGRVQEIQPRGETRMLVAVDVAGAVVSSGTPVEPTAAELERAARRHAEKAERRHATLKALKAQNGAAARRAREQSDDDAV